MSKLRRFIRRIPRRLFAVLTAVFSCLLCIVIVVSGILNQYKNSINDFLHINTSVIQGGGTGGDSIYWKSDYADKVDSLGHFVYDDTEKVQQLVSAGEAMSEELEKEGLVLMKNDNALPLSSGAKVSLFGKGAVTFNYATSGSSAASTTNYINLKDALESDSVGLQVNATLWDWYKSNMGDARSSKKINEVEWSAISGANSSTFSQYGDAAIMIISRDTGEGSDAPASGSDGQGGDYLALSAQEIGILKGLKTSFGKVIVLLNSSSTVQLDFLDNPEIRVDALMWVGNVGKAGIKAVAKALVGAVVPSGRLSDTYVKDNFSSPAAATMTFNDNKNFSQKYSGSLSGLGPTQYYYGTYVEGIYVGYRYYETRYEDVVLETANVGDYDYAQTVAYPFGYGISYATFEYSNFSVQQETRGGQVMYDISVKVTNTSDKYDGKEVVQVYLQKPYDKTTGLEKASVELVGFAKTKVLKHNGTDDEKSETVKISVAQEQFASYDVNARSGKGGYVLDNGSYYLAVGTDSHDALNNILAKKGKASAKMTAIGSASAAGKADNVYVVEQSGRDEQTFASSLMKDSKGNSAEISNQLDFADMNRYESAGSNSVTYVSRSNWTGTFPKAKVSFAVNSTMKDDLEMDKDLSEYATTQPRPSYGVDNDITLATMRNKDYDDEAWDLILDQMSFADQAKLVNTAYMGTTAISSIAKPATKDNDGPTGVKASKSGLSFPSEGIWASSFNIELIERAGKVFAEDTLYNDTQTLYATGVNIHRMPWGGRTHEYFSEDPFLTGVAVSYEVAGLQSKGVISTLKHFAFNDEEENRSGVCIWLNEQSAREIYLRPFEIASRKTCYGLENKGVAHGIMTSFNRAGCIWTSASSEILENIARQEWQYDGYYITDMVMNAGTYMASSDAIIAGTDLMLIYFDPDGTGLNDYAWSIPFSLRLREACHRTLYIISHYSAAMNGLDDGSRVITLKAWWETLVSVVKIIIIVLTVLSATAWVIKYVLAYMENRWRTTQNESEVEQIKRN